MTTSSEQPEGTARWQVRPRTAALADGAPTALEVLHDELGRIERRIDDVILQGRDSFREGSDSYDRAIVAVLRLAALFEDSTRYAPHLDVVLPEERRGITTMRDITAHSGYGAINTEIFWRTVTERLPEVIARARQSSPATWR
ncbi:MAG: DUF86 domain-containing protein [Kocuria sp.]|nr:DUF86 domain-containing protein [Kocuria sp.]